MALNKVTGMRVLLTRKELRGKSEATPWSVASGEGAAVKFHPLSVWLCPSQRPLCPGDQGPDDNEVFVTFSQWEGLPGERYSNKTTG